MLSSSKRDGSSTYRDFVDEEGRQLPLQLFIKDEHLLHQTQDPRNHLSHLGKEELVTVTSPLILSVNRIFVENTFFSVFSWLSQHCPALSCLL